MALTPNRPRLCDKEQRKVLHSITPGKAGGDCPKDSSKHSRFPQSTRAHSQQAAGEGGRHRLLVLTGNSSSLSAAREPKEQGRPWDGSWGTSETRRLLPPASPGLRAQAAEAVPSLPPSSPAFRVQGVPATGSENLTDTAHQGAPAAALSHPRGSYLGRDCHQAEGDRGGGGWRRGAATYEAQGVPGRGPSRRCPSPSGGDKRRLRGGPRLQTRRGRSGPPELSTVPSSSPSGAAAWSCSLPRGLYGAGGAPHGQGPGFASV